MAKSRLYRILSRIIDIRPGEEIIASLLFLYFFFIMFPYYIIKPYRDAKYLYAVGSKELPYAYLSTAIAVGIIVALYSNKILIGPSPRLKISKKDPLMKNLKLKV